MTLREKLEDILEFFSSNFLTILICLLIMGGMVAAYLMMTSLPPTEPYIPPIDPHMRP